MDENGCAIKTYSLEEAAEMAAAPTASSSVMRFSLIRTIASLLA